MKQIISTEKAPAAIGPYSQAVEACGMIYTSGQIPVDPATGVIPEGIEAQAEQVLKNVKNLLEAAGTSLENVVKTTVFIKNMEDFGTINGIYAKYLRGGCPAAKGCADGDGSHCGETVTVQTTGTKRLSQICIKYTNKRNNQEYCTDSDREVCTFLTKFVWHYTIVTNSNGILEIKSN